MQAIASALRTYIAQNILFSPDGFTYADEDSFLENGIIDSTGVVELIAFIEDHFNISVEDTEITPQNFDSIANLSAYISGKLNQHR
ncbi:MAG: acyl carrier protein [Anaerolineales bacterium]